MEASEEDKLPDSELLGQMSCVVPKLTIDIHLTFGGDTGLSYSLLWTPPLRL